MVAGLRKVVMFCAHTDDEMVAAGTLHRLARTGTEVHLVAFFSAATRDDRQGTTASSGVLMHEFNRSVTLIGAKRGRFVNFGPSADPYPHRQAICQHVFDYCDSERPDAAFVLSPDDENTAHSIVGTECERVMRGRVPLVVRCQFPWNYSIGRANLFVSLDREDLACKRAVVNAYQSQLWRYDYEEMLVSACRTDGLSVKVPYAEKFEFIRMVV